MSRDYTADEYFAEIEAHNAALPTSMDKYAAKMGQAAAEETFRVVDEWHAAHPEGMVEELIADLLVAAESAKIKADEAAAGYARRR